MATMLSAMPGVNPARQQRREDRRESLIASTSRMNPSSSMPRRAADDPDQQAQRRRSRPRSRRRDGRDGAPHHAREQVAAVLVGPERMGPDRSLQAPAIDIVSGSLGV